MCKVTGILDSINVTIVWILLKCFVREIWHYLPAKMIDDLAHSRQKQTEIKMKYYSVKPSVQMHLIICCTSKFASNIITVC